MPLTRFLRPWLALAGLCLLMAGGAAAQDLAGAKDHPVLMRFAGSSIVGYDARNFDAIEFQTSTFKAFDLAVGARRYVKPPLALEGKLTRLWYEAPGNTRSLELYRNYVNELTSHGFKPLYDSTQDAAAGQWTHLLASFSSAGKDFMALSKRSAEAVAVALASASRTGAAINIANDSVTTYTV